MTPALSTTPLVSVIIPTRNRAERLREVIDALLTDDYPAKEIIVCDGASSDGTVELLRSYGDRVRWVSEHDGGEFKARNKAVAMARGEIVRNLSDDDVPVAGGIEIAVRYFQEHPDIDLLFGQSVNYYVRANGTVVLNDARPTTRAAITLENFIYGRARNAVSETAFFRRSLAERIGPFDTAMSGADYEYWARAAYHGIGIAIVDAVFVHHFRYETGEVAIAKTYRNLLRSMRILADRYGDRRTRWFVRWIYLPYRLARYDLVRLLPAPFAFRARSVLWRLRNRMAPMSETGRPGDAPAAVRIPYL